MALVLARDPSTGVELVCLTRDNYREALTVDATVAEALAEVLFCHDLVHMGVQRHGRMVGFIVYSVDDGVPAPTRLRLHRLLVRQTERRRGVGRSAVELLAALMIERRGQRVMVEARVTDESALAFFSARHFAVFRSSVGGFLCRRLVDQEDLQIPDRAPAAAGPNAE